MSPIKFRTDDSIGGWDVYASPISGWDHRIKQNLLILFTYIIISIYVSWSIYSWMRKYSEVLHDKVELESKYILERFQKSILENILTLG